MDKVNLRELLKRELRGQELNENDVMEIKNVIKNTMNKKTTND